MLYNITNESGELLLNKIARVPYSINVAENSAEGIHDNDMALLFARLRRVISFVTDTYTQRTCTIFSDSDDPIMDKSHISFTYSYTKKLPKISEEVYTGVPLLCGRGVNSPISHVIIHKLLFDVDWNARTCEYTIHYEFVRRRQLDMDSLFRKHKIDNILAM